MTERADLAMGEYVAACRPAIVGAAPADVLVSLGWWDVLDARDDPEARVAMFALLRAQGLELGDTGALGAVVAAPYLAGRDESRVVAALTHDSARRGPVHLLVGDPSADLVLIDRPGAGASLVPTDELVRRPVTLPGRLTLHELVVDAADLEPAVDEAAAAAARPHGIALGRQAAAWEILGAAEGALALAVEHAVGRVQFGQPIGTFQAVRHLLAWAFADAAAVEAVAASALALGGDAPPRYDQVVKAIAGRNARRVCERALQVLGGIGFTAELDHHHFHSRVLTLDSLLGSSTALTAGLGAWIRAERADPGFARAALLASA